MYKVLESEFNPSPSMVNTSSPNEGAASSLAKQLNNEPTFDGITIEQMRGNPIYSKTDDIDKVGLVQKKAVENYKTVKSRESQIRAFNDRLRKRTIPSKS